MSRFVVVQLGDPGRDGGTATLTMEEATKRAREYAMRGGYPWGIAEIKATFQVALDRIDEDPAK